MDNGSDDKPIGTDADDLNSGAEGPSPSDASPASGAPNDDHQGNASDSRTVLSARLKRSKNVELYVFEEDSAGGENSSSLVDVSTLDVDVDAPEKVLPKQQITLKSEQGRLLLLLPPSAKTSFTPSEWEDICQQLTLRLTSGDRLAQPNTAVYLIARDYLLDSRHLQEIDDLLQASKLCMKRVYTQRRQTAVAAATAGYSVEQQTKLEHLGESQGEALDAPLYLQTTVRSGTEIRHQGSIVVLGDVNPGGSLIAAGDIFVWGRLRGVVHAGSEGNLACRIMALHMQPTQLRIADNVARAPEKPPALYQPEVAYISQGNIRIAIAAEFAQIHLNTP